MKQTEPTLCPVCDRPMRLAAVTPRSGNRPPVLTFECRVCCVALTRAQEQPSRPGDAAEAEAMAELNLLASPA